MTDVPNVVNVEFKNNSDRNVLCLYCIKDLKTNQYFPPFFASNYEDAKRSIANTVNYSNSLINKFPQDYELCACGVFDSNTGYCNGIDSKFICNLSELKQDDTIKYDELKKECQTLQMQITSVLKDYEDKEAMYEKKLRELTTIEDFIKSKHTNKDDVECYPVPKKKLSLKKRNSILDFLTK